MMGVFGALWFFRNRGSSLEVDDKPVNKKAVVVLGLIMIGLVVASIILTQPMCPKSEQRTIHVPAVKGETSMDSHEAYDYVVCVKQGDKP